MSSWKTWAGLALLILTAVLLYPHPAPPQSPTESPKTPLTLWVNPQIAESMRAVVDEFEHENPQYRVRIGTAAIREGVGDSTRLLLSIAGDDPPDVAGFDRYSVVELAARGALTSLDPYIAQDANLPDGVHPDDFYSALWDETCYKGHQYAISQGVNTRTLLVNDDLLIRAGFKEGDKARPPTCWEDICRKKFHGGGAVTVQGLVRPGSPLLLLGVGPYPVNPAPTLPGDVVTLRTGLNLFRAHVKDVAPDGSFTIDFTRDLAPDVTSIPEQIVNASDLEIKIFDANSYAVAMTRYDDKGNLDVIGFAPLGGNSWLYNFGWQNGATYLSPDGETILLDEPKLKIALQYLVDCYDAMGGAKLVKAFEDSHKGEDAGKGTSRHPFLIGKIAMMVNGSWFLDTIATFRPDLRFTAVPPPIPQKRLDEGFTPKTWVGGGIYFIPSTSKHPAGAWALIRFLVSEHARKMIYDADASRAHAAGRLYIPDLPFRKALLPYARETYLAHNPAINERLLAAFDAYASLLPHCYYRPSTPAAQKLWESQITAADDAIAHQASVHDILAAKNIWVQEYLNRYNHPPTGPVVRWTFLILGYLLLLAVGAALLARSEIRRRKAGLGSRDWKAGFTCVSPWLVGFIVFGGGPILFSLIISFCRYDALHPAQLVGLNNYIQLLGFHADAATHQLVANDPKLWHSLQNTAFMLLALPLSITLGLLLAMLLNHQLRGISIFRTFFYLPHIVPAIASFLLWYWIFDPIRGLFNRSLMTFGVHHPPAWLSDPAWSKPALIIMGLWGVGGGMLVWLAGLKAIPLELYEAAEIDGAGALRKFFNVTLPMLSPYIFFNTVMGIIGTLQVFESAYVLTDGGPNDSTLFYAYYLFNQSFRYLDMGAASAMAWILFLIVLALTLFQLRLSKKWVHYD